jgi:hypothetical protein
LALTDDLLREMFPIVGKRVKLVWSTASVSFRR